AMGWWMPEGRSTHAGSVDGLFYFILWVTTFFFILTEGILVWFMCKYGSGVEPPESKPPEFITKLIPNQHRLELVWSIVPGVILLIIAFAQVSAWADVKYRSRMPKMEETAENQSTKPPASKVDPSKTPVQLEVSARQFEWRVRYPAPRTMDAWLSGE